MFGLSWAPLCAQTDRANLLDGFVTALMALPYVLRVCCVCAVVCVCVCVCVSGHCVWSVGVWGFFFPPPSPLLCSPYLPLSPPLRFHCGPWLAFPGLCSRMSGHMCEWDN